MATRTEPIPAKADETEELPKGSPARLLQAMKTAPKLPEGEAERIWADVMAMREASIDDLPS
jgi:hypothetical protein